MKIEIANSEGKYTVEQMQQMATIASTADGLSIEGNNFKVCALTGSPDMLLFACEKILKLQENNQKDSVLIAMQEAVENVVGCDDMVTLPMETWQKMTAAYYNPSTQKT